MNKRRIGRTALDVTEIGFGGASIGGLYRSCPREAAMETLQTAWDAGIRYFDTAPFYGFGLSERRMGDFLRDKPRDEYVLSTKVGRLLRPVPDSEIPDHGYVDPLPFAVDYDYSYDGIMRSVEFSYARLGLNRIDILFVHDIGVYTHGVEKTKVHFRQLMDSGLKALDELKSAGAIAAYGLGVNEVQICLDVMRQAPLDCILLAGRYSLLDRSAEAELLALMREARDVARDWRRVQFGHFGDRTRGRREFRLWPRLGGHPGARGWHAARRGSQGHSVAGGGARISAAQSGGRGDPARDGRAGQPDAQP